MFDKNLMKEAINEARAGVDREEGGPFGSVIVKDGKIVGRGHNRVLLKRDPTCHGETEAIRDACKTLQTADLSGCVLYTTAEPCPMCLGAVLWANIDTVYYGCNVKDTDGIGFRDDRFYRYFQGERNLLHMEEQGRNECLLLFREYAENPAHIRY